jgi:hypothetical protein
MSPSGIAVAAIATSVAAAALAAAVWWYRGLPRVRENRQQKDRERMVEGFRKHLRGGSGGPPSRPPEDERPPA